MRKPLDYRSVDFENISFEVTFEENDPEILGIYCERSDINLYPYLQDFLIEALQENLEEALTEEKINCVNDQRKYDWDPETWGKGQMMRYQEIRNINLSDYVEKKNGLNYLSWSWALDQLLLLDENASWEYLEPQWFNETMMVFCRVYAFGKSRTAQLPVMDYLNQPIARPNAFQVNTAMQRCLAKAISLHGLGLYLYSGEDLPLVESVRPPTEPITPLAGVWDQFNHEEKELLHGISESITSMVKKQQLSNAFSYFNSLNQQEKIAVWSALDSKTRRILKAIPKK